MKRVYFTHPQIEVYSVYTEAGFQLSDAGVANVGYETDNEFE